MKSFAAQLYAIAYAIINSKENFRYDTKGNYFHVLVSCRLLFFKRSRKCFPPCYSWTFGRIRNSVETLALRARVPTFSFS